MRAPLYGWRREEEQKEAIYRYIHFCSRPGRMAAPSDLFVWPFSFFRIRFTLFLSPIDHVIAHILFALMSRCQATDRKPQSLLWPPRENGSARRSFRVALFLFLDNIHLVFVTHILLARMSRRRTTDRKPHLSAPDRKTADASLPLQNKPGRFCRFIFL